MRGKDEAGWFSSAEEVERLFSGTHPSPHSVLGCHPYTRDGERGTVVRAFHPDAVAATAQLGGLEVELQAERPGLFSAFVPGRTPPQLPRLSFRFADGARWELADPYSHWPTLGDQDLHLFGEGNHLEVWRILGANYREHQGVCGTAFAVWAPNAVGVALVSDFNAWDRRILPMRMMGSSGIWELFVPGLQPGTRYQFDLLGAGGDWMRKSDPYAKYAELRPGRASVVTGASGYGWRDESYMVDRARHSVAERPMNVYEVHMGSFRHHADGRALSYRELADALVPHMQHFGFTHVELLPVCEHPFDGSWGYQVTGFYAPTSRFGSPDDFRYLVDRCHQHNIGVILDWVPAHFPKDDFALARFDGTPLYEHADPRQGEHPDWGTLIFNYGRNEVANFLIGSALYFLSEFHVDGLRVDAVASMLYLDYSRSEGAWVPNQHGGRENLEAIAFVRRLNATIRDRLPGCYCIAEESTAWGGVTADPEGGGLGFALKWNMGWMHDTLVYFQKDPYHRRYHQHDLTFASIYEHSERFLMPLSHDEVVHGKGSLLGKMPGDHWQKFANLRALYGYQYTRPGKKLLFMGSEFAPDNEWDYEAALPWPGADDLLRQALMRYVSAMGHLYQRSPALYVDGVDSFAWIDNSDEAQSVFIYRRALKDQRLVVVLNLTPVPRENYRMGAPWLGRYRLILNSDDMTFGGSGFPVSTECLSCSQPFHGCDYSIAMNLPPLSAMLWEHEEAEEHSRSRRLGIAEVFYTVDGTRHVTDDRTREFFMRALGDPPVDPAPAQEQDPPKVLAAQAVLAGRRALGLWTQLYTLHSEESWGIGDFADLRRLLRWAGGLGLDFIGLNPLHAMAYTDNPAVPYHPSSRLFNTPLYVAVPDVPEYQALPPHVRHDAQWRERLSAARSGVNVDYPLVWETKRFILWHAYEVFVTLPASHPRRKAYQRFAEREGELLKRFACFCAIHEDLSQRGLPSGHVADMPETLSSWGMPGVFEFMEHHGKEIGFHVYLQFLVDEQLAGCASAAREAGMRVGLYLDLAVGVAHGSFDVWSDPEMFVSEASLGAPPDELAPQGQDWGLAPLHPLRLAAERLTLFREMLRRCMRYAGALRIDHAMGMERQFWTPRSGDLPGTYVAFPLPFMLNVLAEESQAARCLIIAEDLGTVSQGFRPAITARDILRYEVLHFSRDGAGAYPEPQKLLDNALLCLATHDLPTFREFWSGSDLLLRQKLGVMTEAQLLQRTQHRMAEKAALCAWLAAHGHAVDEADPPMLVLKWVHRLLVQGPSPLLALSLDDLTDEPQAVNVPGTTAESGFVSFARRMHRSLEQIEGDVELQQELRALRALMA